MKKTKKQPTTEPATVTPAAEPQQQQPAPAAEPQQERKPDLSRRSSAEGVAKADFYQRLVTERPTEAASILATLCRRKDKALRAMNDAHSAGKDFGDAYRIALSIAFPKAKPATATA